MKKYSDLLDEPYDGYLGREPVEWSNFWYDKANQISDKRYLLIGDSTVRMVRSTFAKVMQCPVDMIGSSSEVDDILFVSQIDAFFSTSKYRYDAIFLQIGHHGRISKTGGEYTDKDLERFRGGNFVNKFPKAVYTQYYY